MLLGEHLGGCQQRRLPARVDDLEHRAQRHDRLARADLSLQQPVHRVVAAEIGGDLVADPLLSVGQRERQPGLEPLTQAAARRRPRPGRQRGETVPPARERHLGQQRLVVAQPVARLVPVARCGGPVDALERLAQSDEVAPFAYVDGHGVVDVVEHIEDQLDRLRDVPRLHLAGGRVDRDERAGEPSAGFTLVQHLALGVQQLRAAVEVAHLAGEQAEGARLELVRPPVLVEEGQQQQRAGAVADHHLGADRLTPAPSWIGSAVDLVRRRDDLGLHRDVLVRLEGVERGEVAPPDIATRVVVQQVVDRVQVEVGSELLGAGATHHPAQPIPGLDDHQRLSTRLTRPRGTARSPPGRPRAGGRRPPAGRQRRRPRARPPGRRVRRAPSPR